MSRSVLLLSFAIFTALGLYGLEGMARTIKGETLLRSSDIRPIEVFSFKAGLTNIGNEVRNISKNVDLFYNSEKGLGSNSAGFGPEFHGGGGIKDMGTVPLESIEEAPESGYNMYVQVKRLKPGKAFCVRCGDGLHFAKIRILEIKKGKEGFVKFSWVYQPAGGRSFK